MLGKGELRRQKHSLGYETGVALAEAPRGRTLKATSNLGQRQAVTMLHQPQAKHAGGAVGGCPGKTSVITTEADGTNLSSSCEAIDEEASTFVRVGKNVAILPLWMKAQCSSACCRGATQRSPYLRATK